MAYLQDVANNPIQTNFTALNNSLLKKTVGFQDGMDYTLDSAATNCDVAINAAITAVNVAGGGTVELGMGTFTISTPILAYSNVTLKGSGLDITTIKAKNNYEATTDPAAHTDARIMLMSATSGGLSNFIVEGITWDGNVTNIPGLSNNTHHRIVWLQGSSSNRATNIHFRKNKVINGINWSVFFQYTDELWIEDNIVLGGYSTEYGFNDGIHCRNVKYFNINRNYVDTDYGSGTSGDDAIVVISEAQTSDDTLSGMITNNIISAGSSGIKLGTDGSKNIQNVIVADNVIWHSDSAGIVLEKFTDGSTGQILDILVDNNIIYNYSSLGGGGIRISDQVGQTIDEKGFDNITISNNTISSNIDALNTRGLDLDVKGNFLKVVNNKIVNFTGTHGILVGGTKHPIQDVTIMDNTVEYSGSSVLTGIKVFGVNRGVVSGNNIYGTFDSSTAGIAIHSGSTAGVDSQSSPNTEYSQYLTILGNQIAYTTTGIDEVNSGNLPTHNNYLNNNFSSVTTVYGANIINNSTDTIIGSDSSGNYGVGTGAPDTKLHIVGTTAASTVSVIKLQNSATATNTGSAIDWNLSTANMGVNPSARIRGVRTGSPGGDLAFHTLATAGNLVERARISADGNIVLGKNASVAVGATDGFVYVPTSASSVTGTPTAYTGMVPLVYDVGNNKLRVYNGSWKSVDLT